jgi:hypothetical protein
MVNWFYVVGSDRVGPISEIMLKGLLDNGEINSDTYVWRKGFQGWERLKDVAELHTSSPEAETLSSIVSQDSIQEKVKEESSPEVRLTFNWKKVKENEEMFYLKIGKDRKNFAGHEIFGPYSLVEIREAIEQKRINQNTLIFAPGMNAWTKIQSTPSEAGLQGAGSSDNLSLEEVPLLLVMKHSPLPLITIVKKAGTKELSLLGAGPFNDYQGQTVLASLYVGNEIKAKNVKIKIENYQIKEQTVQCAVEQLDQEARNIILNHAV